MSYRSHNQRDANQPEIVAALRERGAYVVEIEHPVDLLVGYNGFWVLVEVKSGPKAKIRPSQQAFADQCQDKGLGCIFLKSLGDVDYWFPEKSEIGKNSAMLPATGKDATADTTTNSKHGS